MPAAPQAPNPINGIVRLNNTPVRGAKVWALDISEGTNIGYKQNVSVSYTNARGEFVLDMADLTTAYKNNDTVRLYIEYGEIVTFIDVTLSGRGVNAQVSINLTRTSRLTDGLTGTLDSDGLHGLERFARGLKRGLKDALQGG